VVCGIAGTLIEAPATEIVIITRNETVMQAAAVQTSPRFWTAVRMFRSRTVFTPQKQHFDEQTVSDAPFRIG
jgi:hypothetical protein